MKYNCEGIFSVKELPGTQIDLPPEIARRRRGIKNEHTVRRRTEALPKSGLECMVPKKKNETRSLLIEFQDEKMKQETTDKRLTTDRSAELLKQSEAKYRHLTDSIDHMFFSLDRNLRLSYWNKASETFTGIPSRDALGKSLDDVFPDQRNWPGERIFREVMETGQTRRLELLFTGKGKDSCFEAIIYPSDGAISVLLKDISHLREVENELKDQGVMLEQAAKEIESFCYSLSHDIRQPLRAIDGFSRMLVKECSNGLNEETKRKLEIVRSRTGQMGMLIDDLLDFYHLGRQAFTKTVIDMQHLAANVVHEIRQNEPHRDISINVGTLPDCTGDFRFIRQVLVHLIANAVKFTKCRQQTVIEIGGQEKEGACIYYVRDNGVGFDMQYYDKLFRIFNRLQVEEEYEGTGVGLSIVKRIIERHGGRVWAEGSVNEGATFYFSLPKGIR